MAVHVVPRKAVRLAPGSLRGSALRRRDRDARGCQALEGFANRVRRLVLGHGRLQQRAEPRPLGHPQNRQPGLLDVGPPPRLAPGNSQLRAHHPGDDLRLRESGPLRRRRNRLGSAPAERPGPHAGGNQLRAHRRRDGGLRRDRQGTQSRPASFRDAALWLRPHPAGRNRGEIRPRNRFRAVGTAAQLAPLRGSGRRDPASGSESLQGRANRTGLPQLAVRRDRPRGRPAPDGSHQDQALDLPLLRNRRRLPRAGHGAVPDRPRRYPRRDRAALRRHGLDAQGLERPFQHPDHRRPLPDRQPDRGRRRRRRRGFVLECAERPLYGPPRRHAVHDRSPRRRFGRPAPRLERHPRLHDSHWPDAQGARAASSPVRIRFGPSRPSRFRPVPRPLGGLVVHDRGALRRHGRRIAQLERHPRRPHRRRPTPGGAAAIRLRGPALGSERRGRPVQRPPRRHPRYHRRTPRRHGGPIACLERYPRQPHLSRPGTRRREPGKLQRFQRDLAPARRPESERRGRPLYRPPRRHPRRHRRTLRRHRRQPPRLERHPRQPHPSRPGTRPPGRNPLHRNRP